MKGVAILAIMLVAACGGGQDGDAEQDSGGGQPASGQGQASRSGGAGGAPQSGNASAPQTPAAPPAGSQLLEVAVSGLTPGIDSAGTRIANPYENDDNAIADGELFFNNFNCSGCHAALGGGGMGPPLSDTLWIYGGEPANVYLSILQGRPNGMPSWHQLPPDVIWKIVAYIHTLPERARQISSSPTRP